MRTSAESVTTESPTIFARVAVQFRHNDAVQLQRLVKRLGAVNGVLTGHAVHNQIHLIGLHAFVDPLKLSHQFLIDGQSSGGVQNQDLNAVLFGLAHGVLANFDRILSALLRINGHAQLFAQNVQLFNRRRTLQIRRRQHRASFIFQ